MRISDWSSDVCSSDLGGDGDGQCRDQPPGGDDRLYRRFLADDVGDAGVGAAGAVAAPAQAGRTQGFGGGYGALGASALGWEVAVPILPVAKRWGGDSAKR